MPTFTRIIVGGVLVISLSFLVGCSATQSNSKKSTNVFSFPKAEQKERTLTMEEFLARDRVK